LVVTILNYIILQPKLITMDHIVYLDTKSNELEKLIDSEKSMIIRGWTGRKMPY